MFVHAHLCERACESVCLNACFFFCLVCLWALAHVCVLCAHLCADTVDASLIQIYGDL